MRPWCTSCHLAARIAFDDNICTLTRKVLATNALLPALSALALLCAVVLVDLAFHESLHFLLALAGQRLLFAAEVRADGENAGGQTDGNVFVLFLTGDDGKREDGRGVLQSAHDIPARCLEDLDVTVEGTGEQTRAIVRKRQSRDGLLVIA